MKNKIINSLKEIVIYLYEKEYIKEEELKELKIDYKNSKIKKTVKKIQKLRIVK